MKEGILDLDKNKVGEVELIDDIFSKPLNSTLIYDAVKAQLASRRQGDAFCKNRALVSGSTHKIYRQKGTGRARHGSTRSPIWVGGGTTHGPRNERNYDKKINKKVKAKSLAIILSQKARDNEIVLIDSLSLNEIKTKEAVSIINSLAKNDSLKGLKTKKNNAGIISLSERNENTEKSFRNISNLKMDLVQNLNISDLLKYKYLVLVNPKESFEILTGRVKTGKVTENNK